MTTSPLEYRYSSSLHLLPVEDAKVAGLGVVFAAEREVRVAHRLQEHARNAVALAVEHLEERVELRRRTRCVDLEHPLLAGLGREAVEVGIGLDRLHCPTIVPVIWAGSCASAFAWAGALFGSCSETRLDLAGSSAAMTVAARAWAGAASTGSSAGIA